MKRLFILILALCLFVTGCTNQNSEPHPVTIDKKESQELIGVWITFSELGDFSQKGFEVEFENAVKKCIELGVNNLFVHVRPFCDAVYESKIFPKSKYVGGYDGDALEFMVNTAHKYGVKIHAWINPYRVSTASNDISTLPDNSPAKMWLSDESDANDTNVCIIDNGIYLNPASAEVKKLILSGVREIIENYAVDGIHLDDYFYPTTSAAFDEGLYNEYKQNASVALDLADWRRQNVNSLIHTLYCAIKAFNKNIQFGVSPAADIDRCYNELFADVEAWAHGGYVDYIMPQLYFGFEYPIQKFNFDSLLPIWQAMLDDTNASLYVGLANYKIGTNTEPDKAEWNKYNDIISRQIILLRENKADGFVFFSYSSLFSDNKLNIEQTQNIKEIIKK